MFLHIIILIIVTIIINNNDIRNNATTITSIYDRKNVSRKSSTGILAVVLHYSINSPAVIVVMKTTD